MLTERGLRVTNLNRCQGASQPSFDQHILVKGPRHKHAFSFGGGFSVRHWQGYAKIIKLPIWEGSNNANVW